VFLDISLILFGSPDYLFPVALSPDKTVGACDLLLGMDGNAHHIFCGSNLPSINKISSVFHKNQLY
jgi:hypothetical protein